MRKRFAVVVRYAAPTLGALAVVWTTGVSAGVEDRFPNTTRLGEAAVQYREDGMAVVVAYYYSQRHHESRWLLIEAGIGTHDRMIINRDDFRLVAPDGQVIPLASQARFAEDLRATRLVVQNASTVRHPVQQYFADRAWSVSISFFALPGGGIVRRDFHVDGDHLASGDLFFESPSGSWEPGTYTLVVAAEGVLARLPIDLK